MTKISPDIYSALKKFNLPDEIGFGKVIALIMYRADYRDGNWGIGELLRYGGVTIEPAAKILHYGQSIFEGMKAYKEYA